MGLPFTPDQFLELFAEYNRAFWFIALMWWLGSAGVIAAAWGNPVRASPALTLFLGALWAWNAVARDATVLRRCSWQRIIAAMERHDDLQWLIPALDCKYGLAPRRRHDAVANPGSSA